MASKYEYLDFVQGTSLSLMVEGPMIVQGLSTNNVIQRQLLASLDDEWDLSNLIDFMKEYGYSLISINLSSNPKYRKEITFKRYEKSVYDNDLPEEIAIEPKYIDIFSVN